MKPLFLLTAMLSTLFCFAQNVGIGTATPQTKLHIKNDNEILRLQGASNYISFFDNDGNYTGYLWNRSNNAMDLGTPAASNFPITISPNTFTSATFHANGNLGLGVPDPGFRLDVLGRMRLRHQGASAGIWLNNSTNTTSPAFMGLAADNQVGFYGNGSGWAFTVNTDNGNAGLGVAPDNNAKFYLRSNVPGAAVVKLGTGKIVAEGAGVNSATTVFVHKAMASNTPGVLGYTVIDNPYCNNNPDAILIVTMNGTYGSGNGAGFNNTPEQTGGSVTGPQIVSATSFMIVYNGPACIFYSPAPAYARDKWIIRTYSGQSVVSPLNFNFNVQVFNPN